DGGRVGVLEWDRHHTRLPAGEQGPHYGWSCRYGRAERERGENLLPVCHAVRGDASRWRAAVVVEAPEPRPLLIGRGIKANERLVEHVCDLQRVVPCQRMTLRREHYPRLATDRARPRLGIGRWQVTGRDVHLREPGPRRSERKRQLSIADFDLRMRFCQPFQSGGAVEGRRRHHEPELDGPPLASRERTGGVDN